VPVALKEKEISQFVLVPCDIVLFLTSHSLHMIFFLHICHPPFDKLFFPPSLSTHSLWLCFFLITFTLRVGFTMKTPPQWLCFIFPLLLIDFFFLTSHFMSVSAWKLKTYSFFSDLTNLEDNETIKGESNVFSLKIIKTLKKLPKNSCTSNLNIWT
jgi:energy-coupling factor transporter transmembrane protein EcfT